MANLMQDLRFTVRRLLRNPAFTVVALLSLTLGIGLNAVVFSLFNLILLRPLPVAQPEELVRVYTSRDSGFRFGALSYPDYVDLRDRGTTIEGLVAERFIPISLSSDGSPELLWGELVTGNYFQVLGVPAAAGRTLLPEDDQAPGAHPVVVISHGLWQSRFGGREDAVGRSVILNGRSFTVIGVAEAGFGGTFVANRADLWVPMMMQREMMPIGDRLETRGARWLTATARLAPGMSLAQAATELNGIADQLEQGFPVSNEGTGSHLVSFEEDTLPFQSQGYASLGSSAFLVVAAMVLLIACANLANVLLAQAAARQREVAMRQALGAGRGRLLVQFFSESLLISLLAAVLALPLAAWVTQLIARIPTPSFIPLDLSLHLDWRVVVFTFVLSIGVGLFLGLLPALRATKFDLVRALRGDGLDRAGSGLRLRNVLVVAQVTLSLVLLICAGLFLKSLRNSLQVDPGFESSGVFLASVNLGLQGYGEERGRTWYRQLLDEVRALPGVENAALGEIVPMTIGGGQQVGLDIDGLETVDGSQLVVDYNLVSADYFDTLGISLLDGRVFSPAEDPEARLSVIVNQTMAQSFWRDGDCLGRQLRVAGREAQVVGVVADIKYDSITESSRPFLYLPFAQSYEPAMTLHVATAGDPAQLGPQVRTVIRSMDENLPVFNVQTLKEHLSFALFPAKAGAVFLAIFGLLALILAALGTYGVMTYFVALRRREIGIRSALGASSEGLLRMVLWRGLSLVLIGVGLGLLLAVGAAQGVSALLVGVSALEVSVFLGVALLLLAVAAVTIFIPARTATRIDPAVVLRGD